MIHKSHPWHNLAINPLNLYHSLSPCWHLLITINYPLNEYKQIHIDGRLLLFKLWNKTNCLVETDQWNSLVMYWGRCVILVVTSDFIENFNWFIKELLSEPEVLLFLVLILQITAQIWETVKSHVLFAFQNMKYFANKISKNCGFRYISHQVGNCKHIASAEQLNFPYNDVVLTGYRRRNDTQGFHNKQICQIKQIWNVTFKNYQNLNFAGKGYLRWLILTRLCVLH